MEKRFENPELIIVLFENNDIITSSNGEGYGDMPGDDDDW